MAAALDAILPQDEEEFATVAYWDKFYALRDDKPFEWYVDAARGAAIVAAALGDAAAGGGERLVVNLGCGTCEVPRALAEARAARPALGALRVLSVDNSAGCVATARARQAPAAVAGCALDFAAMDALDLDVPDGSAAVLFDKGLVDALHPRDDAARRATMAKLLRCARAKLAPGGTLVVVSMLQGHVRALLEAAAAADFHATACPAPAGAPKLLPFALFLRPGAPGAAYGGDALRHRGADALAGGWAELWARVDAAVAAAAPATREAARVAVVGLDFRLRGKWNGRDAAEALVARLGGLPAALDFRWAEAPRVEPVAFGVCRVAAAAAARGDRDPDALRDALGAALGAVDADDAATSSSDDDDDGDGDAPRTLECAWPEVTSLTYGEGTL